MIVQVVKVVVETSDINCNKMDNVLEIQIKIDFR